MSIEHSTGLAHWFAQQGWQPFPFQISAWQAWEDGQSGIIHAPTGTGKTMAAWGAPVAAAARANDQEPGLRVLWLTPLRALAADTVESLRQPLPDLNLDWRVEARTGDTSSALRQRQKRQLPHCLVTTPESLSLLLSYKDAGRRFRRLTTVIVDEWHELLGSKRGVQTELCLARLRHLAPGLRTWGLSATLGNLDEAMAVLLGNGDGRFISADLPKQFAIETIIPDDVERFPWAGHLGLRLLPDVVQRIREANSTLLFTNTRNQAETWFRAITESSPELAPVTALHHGSLDRQTRNAVESGLANGHLRCVAATSSLDLGVDFRPVDQVIQIGTAKGVARLLQRAGRAGHQPGEVSRVVCVPTNGLELLEFAAARTGIETRAIEARPPVSKPLDLLAQHLVTIAAGDGFTPDDAFCEVRKTHAFRDLTREEFDWVMAFVEHGGDSLRAYPEYSRIARDDGGRYRIASRQLATRHRMTVGTINSHGALQVKMRRGGALGSVEEAFLAQLRTGDSFYFAGRALELIRIRDMVAVVKPAKGPVRTVPRWVGGRLPLSNALATLVQHKFAEFDRDEISCPEMAAVAGILRTQRDWSALPRPGRLLIETLKSREGHHCFLYPFGGRLVNEGLGALLAARLARVVDAGGYRITANDYGIELVADVPFPADSAIWRRLLSPTTLVDDLFACLNASELMRRKFRDVARVAGLIFPGYPGRQKQVRQLQASGSLLFEVFSKYDPDNLLLTQSRREVLDEQLQISRLRQLMDNLATSDLVITQPANLTPLAFPLWADRVATSVRSDTAEARIAKMLTRLEKAAKS